MTIFLIIFLDLVGIGIIIPIIGPLFLDPNGGIFPSHYLLHIKTILLGFLMAAYPFAQFFGAPLLGGLSDRYGRKKILLLSLLGTFAGYVLFAVGIMEKSIIILFISRLLDGFTGGNISIVMSTIADVSNEKEKTKNFGLVGMAFGLGFILGPFLGGKLADPSLVSWFSYATPFWFCALVTCLNIILVLYRFKETIKKKVHKPIGLFTGFHNMKKAWQMKNVRVMFGVIFLLTIGFNFFTQFFSVFLIEKFHFTQSMIGEYFAYIGIWIAISQGLVTRQISKKVQPHKVLRVAMIGLSIALALLLLPRGAYILYFISPLIAIFQGLILPNYNTLVSNLADPSAQGEIMGINQSMQSLAQTIPPVISGFIVTLHMNMPILVGSIATLAGWFVFILFFDRKKKETFQEVA